MNIRAVLVAVKRKRELREWHPGIGTPGNVIDGQITIKHGAITEFARGHLAGAG